MVIATTPPHTHTHLAHSVEHVAVVWAALRFYIYNFITFTTRRFNFFNEKSRLVTKRIQYSKRNRQFQKRIGTSWAENAKLYDFARLSSIFFWIYGQEFLSLGRQLSLKNNIACFVPCFWFQIGQKSRQKFGIFSRKSKSTSFEATSYFSSLCLSRKGFIYRWFDYYLFEIVSSIWTMIAQTGKHHTVFFLHIHNHFSPELPTEFLPLRSQSTIAYL